jgi:hypothetical protein
MEWLGPRVAWSQTPLRPVAKVFLSIQVLLLVMSHLTSPRGPEALRDHHWRTFDSQELARLVEAPAHRALAGGAICFVSGPSSEAGALALQLADHPLVLIDGRYDRSPWVDRDQVKRCGLLELQHGAVQPGGQPVGPAFEGWWWRIIAPETALNGAAPPRAAMQ